jgi:hypothetical protein
VEFEEGVKQMVHRGDHDIQQRNDRWCFVDLVG